MTRTARYNAETNTFRELPGMEKPKRPFAANYDSQENFDLDLQHYEFLITGYQKHLASLREIPCHESCRSVFKDQQVYEEGKEYELKKWCKDPEMCCISSCSCKEFACPVSPKSEDELWKQVVDEIIEFVNEGQAMLKNKSIQGVNDFLVGRMKRLQQKYTITPR